jgi:hypothetical protein
MSLNGWKKGEKGEGKLDLIRFISYFSAQNSTRYVPNLRATYYSVL